MNMMSLSGGDWLKKIAFAAALGLTLTPDQSIAQGPTAGRIPTSFRWYYNFHPRGWRHWFRADGGTWIERYGTGQESKFFTRALSIVTGCNGIILVKDDNSIQAFIPDQCTQQNVLFQRLVQPGGNWQSLGEMKDTSYRF
jgi:hypothetical protein